MKKHILIYSVLLFVMLSCVKVPSKRTIIQTEKAPAAIGPYSQGVLVGKTLYAAGQIGLDPGTSEMVGLDLESQTRQVLDNLQAVLEEAGFTINEVVSVNVYLSDMNDYSAFNEIYSEYFSESKPARAVVEVSRIPRDAKVEIKLVASK